MKNKNSGISVLGILFLGVIVILFLSYFKISIREVVESEAGQDNISYVQTSGESLWTKYLAEPARYLWNDVWLEIFWRPFIQEMKNLRDGKGSSFSAPTVNY
ncbi:MAG TPA: hypothetical protein VJB95_00915 [Candidatus Paceibacterota bacterium]